MHWSLACYIHVHVRVYIHEDVYLNAVCVGLDCFLFQVANKLVAESGAEEVGHPEHGDKHACR